MKFLNLLVFSLAFAHVYGATFTLDNSVHEQDFDWTKGENYVDGKAPGENDTVIIPANITAKVIAGENPSFNLVNSLYRIKPSAGAKLQVVAEGEENVTNCLTCIVGSLDTAPLSKTKPDGMLEKTGSGTLLLGNGSDRIHPSSYCCDYAVDISVKEGLLILPQNRTNGKSLVVGILDIAENASLMLSSPANFQIYSYGLFGAGTVFYPNKELNADNKVQYLIINVHAADGIEKSVFSGAILGYVRLTAVHPAIVNLTGTNSDFSGSPVFSGRLGVMNFGKETDPTSSIGTGNINFSGTGAVVEYLGTEPTTTDKPFWWTGYATIDAGVFGGVTFTKKFSNTGEGQYVIHLTGSNTTECVIANPFISTYHEDENKTLKGTPCLKKTGTGTWRLTDHTQRYMHGVICVEDGTLKFDSIAERGEMCSLGYSDALRECKHGAFDALEDVNHAFLFGGEGTIGTMEYTGSEYGWCTSRLMAVKSSGRFVSDSAPYWLKNVYAFGPGNKIFTLSGSSDHGNIATLLSDGTEGGKLNVVKDGPGTWTLAKPTSFTGELFVTGGVLKVENNANYRWYRMNFTENGYGSSRYDTEYSLGVDANGNAKAQSVREKVTVQLLEWAMYDAEGNNILLNLQTGESPLKDVVGDPIAQYNFDDNYRTQKISTAAFGSKKTYYANVTNGKLMYLFDGKSTKAYTYIGADSDGITINDPSSWMSIVVRLPDDAPEAVRLDFMSSMSSNATDITAEEVSATYNGRILTAYRLDGSVDGINWDIGIAQNNALDAPAVGTRWYSDHSDSSFVLPRKDKGYEFLKTKPTSVPSHSFTKVGVGCGGILEVVGSSIKVSGLVIDASLSSGVLRNITFAAQGTVDVRNLDVSGADSVELPGDFSALAGFENLSKWNLLIDGDTIASSMLTIKDGKLYVEKRGLRVIIR